MSSEKKLRPLYVQVHPQDTVAIIVNEGGLPAGTQFDSGLTLIEDIPEAHKVALTDIEAKAAILRYGSVIGFAEHPIRKAVGCMRSGCVFRSPHRWIIFHSQPQPQSTCLRSKATPFRASSTTTAPSERKTFSVSPPLCSVLRPLSTFAVKRIKAEILPRYPNVDDVIALTHNYGCGVAIDAPGAEIPIRTLRNLSLNPNLGGAPMVVSLGCEKLQPVRLLPSSTLPILAAAPYVVRMQDEQHHSFGDMVTPSWS